MGTLLQMEVEQAVTSCTNYYLLMTTDKTPSLPKTAYGNVLFCSVLSHHCVYHHIFYYHQQWGEKNYSRQTETRYLKIISKPLP